MRSLLVLAITLLPLAAWLWYLNSYLSVNVDRDKESMVDCLRTEEKKREETRS